MTTGGSDGDERAPGRAEGDADSDSSPRARRASEPTETETEADRAVTVTVLGVDIVLEPAITEFPWRAGLWQAPIAAAGSYLLVAMLVLVGGAGSGSFGDQVASIGLVTYNAHNIHAAVGYVPDLLVGLADPLSNARGLWRWIRGLFTIAVEHKQPLAHPADIAGGKTDAIGHLNYVERQPDPDVPPLLYYLVPVSVLAGVGYAFADNRWSDLQFDSPLGVIRVGLAVALGYVVVLLLGTIPFTILAVSSLGGSVIVLPDRYLILVFGVAYPTVFASLGAFVVYLQRGR